MAQQKYKTIAVFCIVLIINILIANIRSQRKVENKICDQQLELNKLRKIIINLSSELEKSKLLQRKCDVILAKYQILKMEILKESVIYKKMRQLVDQNIPRNKEVLITEEYWQLIEKQVKMVFPDLRCFLLEHNPDLIETEWRYCCLLMFGFDCKEESKLLNITPASVSAKRNRLRQKLNISTSPEKNLYDFLIKNVY